MSLLPARLVPAIGLVFVLGLIGWARGGSAAAVPVEDVNAPLTPGDAIVVEVEGVGQTGIPPFREIVDSDGNILLPFAGMLRATGLTPQQLADDIASRYAESGLASPGAVAATVEPVMHFDPPPERALLRRAASPLRPVPVAPQP